MHIRAVCYGVPLRLTYHTVCIYAVQFALKSPLIKVLRTEFTPASVLCDGKSNNYLLFLIGLFNYKSKFFICQYIFLFFHFFIKPNTAEPLPLIIAAIQPSSISFFFASPISGQSSADTLSMALNIYFASSSSALLK